MAYVYARIDRQLQTDIVVFDRIADGQSHKEIDKRQTDRLKVIL